MNNSLICSTLLQKLQLKCVVTILGASKIEKMFALSSKFHHIIMIIPLNLTKMKIHIEENVLMMTLIFSKIIEDIRVSVMMSSQKNVDSMVALLPSTAVLAVEELPIFENIFQHLILNMNMLHLHSKQWNICNIITRLYTHLKSVALAI